MSRLLEEAPPIALDEAELARQQVQAEEARRAEEYTPAKQAYEHVKSDSLENHELLGARLRDIEETSSFEDYLERIQKAEDDITGETKTQKFIGRRLLLRPRHQTDRIKAYNEYMDDMVERQVEARRRARIEKSLKGQSSEENDTAYIIARERLLIELRDRFEPKKAGSLRRAAEKVRQNPKVRRIGKFVVSDLPNALGPSLPKNHEFLSDHYQHYQETLRQEEEAHANGTLTPAEKLAAELKEQEALRVFEQDAPSIDKLYQMIGRETSSAKLLELRQAMGWLADDLRQAGIEDIEARVGDSVDPSTHNVIKVIGHGKYAEISSIERLGFQMVDGKLIRPADVIVRRHDDEPS